ncbi:DUF2637 domain-containing protein [Kitasatospora sp. GP82]|uniref:DUF2637 domain-containing protein n=1 Tax=Kitasatospora sp. GP82 TaxID=3035089 RepID=UPI0024758649|nr:DUF2637 domain-containing protein [Kitasatospora sp. GP82]
MLWPQVVGALARLLTVLTVTSVCLLGGMLSYDPLRDLSLSRVPPGVAHLWPAVVYGPWLAGSLSILRAAMGGRRIAHAWVVVVVFSAVATALCIAHTAPTMPDLIIAGLPPFTSLTALHQLVRQITATRRARPAPSHKAPTPKTPRHRSPH